MFTNVYNPRAEIERKNEFLQLMLKGVTIGANATIVCGNKLVPSFVGAGAVITKPVKPHAYGWKSQNKLVGYRMLVKNSINR